MFLLFLTSCQESKTIKTTSKNFGSKTEKIKFLKSYLNLEYENFTDLDFYIDYQDNSTGMVPAPSDWDIYIIAKVKDIEPWIKDKEKLESKPNELNPTPSVRKDKGIFTMDQIRTLSKFLMDSPLQHHFRTAFLLSFMAFLRISNLAPTSPHSFDPQRQLCWRGQ